MRLDLNVARRQMVAEGFLSTSDPSEIALLDELVAMDHAEKRESLMIPGFFVYWATYSARKFVAEERAAPSLFPTDDDGFFNLLCVAAYGHSFVTESLFGGPRS